MNVLISSGGRRIELARCFRESLSEIGTPGRLIAVDATPYAPIASFVDAFYIVPACEDPSFISVLKEICEREKVDVLVPTIDSELPVYAAVREEFRARGTVIGVSGPETIAISCDKTLTHSWLTARGFPVPRQSTPADVLAHRSEWALPIIVKPNDGSASVGVRVLHSFEALVATAQSTNPVVVQEVILGQEHTVNVFVNRAGACICAVPHVRLAVRAGEVSKGVTVRHAGITDTVVQLVDALPDAYGALNVQCFVTPANEIFIIEVNARFGGGYPLTHTAGAPITRWLLDDVLGSGPDDFRSDWQEGLLMLRYDEAVYMRICDVEKRHLHGASPHLTRSPRQSRNIDVKTTDSDETESSIHHA